jgi:SAM-dependent methyltransferase
MDAASFATMAKTEDSHWWYVGRRAIIARFIESMALPRDAQILEIGCGTGGNLAMLRGFGSVTAVEADRDACTYARSKRRIIVEQGRLPGPLNLPGSSFDLICLFDVLEHVDADEEALLAIRKLLGPAGRLLLTVPAHPWLWSSHDERLEHQRRYSRSQLLDLLRRAGYRVRRCSYFNAFLFPAIVVGRAIDRVLGRKRATGTAIPLHPLNSLLGSIFSLEARMVGTRGIPFGASILVMADVGTGNPD